MRVVRSSSFEEFVRWYLARERRKLGKLDVDTGGGSWNSRLTEMRRSHPAKLRPWFEGARWSIVLLEAIADAMSLVCVDSWETRRNGLVTDSGIDNRVLRTVVAAASENSPPARQSGLARAPGGQVAKAGTFWFGITGSYPPTAT